MLRKRSKNFFGALPLTMGGGIADHDSHAEKVYGFDFSKTEGGYLGAPSSVHILTRYTFQDAKMLLPP